MIAAKKINEIIERWGIDVVVRFTEDLRNIDITKTFSFVSQKQLNLEYNARIIKAIANIENKITESKIPKDDDITTRVDEFFETKTTMSKTEYENIKNTELTVGGIKIG